MEVIKKERVLQVCAELVFRGHLFHINHDYTAGLGVLVRDLCDYGMYTNCAKGVCLYEEKWLIFLSFPSLQMTTEHTRPRTTSQLPAKDHKGARALVLQESDSLHLSPKHCRFEAKQTFLVSPRLTSTFLNEDQLEDLVCVCFFPIRRFLIHNSIRRSFYLFLPSLCCSFFLFFLSISLSLFQCLSILSFSHVSSQITKMQEPTSGLPLGDRIHNYRKYHYCFVGSDGVDWVVRHSGIPQMHSRMNAVMVFQMLMDK